jgi:2-furoyl-CoA dehydrogenase large subunit
MEHRFTNKKWVGARLKSKEHERLVRGQGEFTDDLQFPDVLYAGFVRSPYARARIVKVDFSRAQKVPGFVCSLTGDEVERLTLPFPNNLPEPHNALKDYCMAVGTARYAGETVAAFAVADKYAVEDVLELIDVEYEPLDPVLDPFKGMESSSPLVHENVPTNVVWHRTFEYGDVDAAFRAADLVVKDQLYFHRFTSAPLENSVVVADYDRRVDQLTIWSNNQRPMFNMQFMSPALRMPPERIRCITPDIGGGFGIKNDSYPYLVIVSLLARKAGRPVKWVEDRTQHMSASAHGNEVFYDAEIAVKKDGTILGLRARAVHDEGAYIRREPIGAVNFIRHSTVGYTFPNLKMEICAVATNKCPVGPNRSYGKMQQCFLVERMMELAARRLGIDCAEMRLKNFVRPEQMPFETPSGSVLDGGDYPGALRKAMEMVDYAGVKEQQAGARQQGRYLGVGIALGMDACPVNSRIQRVMNPAARASGDAEAAWVRIGADGGISAAVGSSPQGQSHETIVSQIVADVLGVHPDEVHAERGFDSSLNPSTPQSGTFASRFAIVGVGAVLGAAQKVRQKVLQIAAHMLGGVDAATLDMADGLVFVKTDPNRRLTLKDVAFTAWKDLESLPEDLEAGLFGHYVYRANFGLSKKQDITDKTKGNFSLTYSYAVTAIVVDVDVETGRVKVLKLATVDDAGELINPLIVEGQIHGAIGHQLGAALYERHYYDDNGQLLTSTFKDYLAPTAQDFPAFEVAYLHNPSTGTPWGSRGVGEGGGSPLIALANAVSDALEPFGVQVKSTHVSPDYIVEQVKATRTATAV